MTNPSCTDRKASVALYLRAALQIDRGDHDTGEGCQTEGACDVLGNIFVSNIHRPDLASDFNNMFVAGQYRLMDSVCDSLEETRAVRILALCFMAAMVEAGDA